MDNDNKDSINNEMISKKAQMMKRNSLMADDLDNFDPSELELEDDDDWRDVFDDIAPPESSSPNETMLMPPPADKKKEGAISSIRSLGSISEHSLKRRRRTSAQVERAENGATPPTWHSPEADLKHRQAMVQDM